MLSVLSARGPLAGKYVLAAPDCEAKKSWARALELEGVQFIAVPRRAGGAKDPNDIAVAAEATRLASTGVADTVALAVQDIDFLYLARRLRAWGIQVLLLMPRLTRSAREFEELGVELIELQDKPGDKPAEDVPLMKAVLGPTGRGRVERIDGSEPLDASPDDDGAVQRKLLDYGYLAEDGDAITPAIARFYVANALGPLAVWPPRLAFAQFRAEVVERGRRAGSGAFCQDPGNLVFVFPCGMKKHPRDVVSKYGTDTAARLLIAGGPFVCKDSARLPRAVLRRLGYLDDSRNTDLSEAIDTFVNRCDNRRTLKDLRMGIPGHVSVHRKKAMLHAALTSTRAHGIWQRAPSCSSLREFLLNRGHISSLDCSVDEAWEGARAYAQEHEIPVPKTYNMLVSRVLSAINNHPMRRV